jgi:mRNA-degrading endonuclease RelE of RelBE toxin-antitoxin system
MQYKNTEEFEKDIKHLHKKFRSILEDLEMVKQNAIELYHIREIDNHSIFPIPNFCTDEVVVCKIKKFACKSLKGRGVFSGIRVIYAYYKQEKKIEFLEIYFKGEKVNEDKERIKMYLKN